MEYWENAYRKVREEKEKWERKAIRYKREAYKYYAYFRELKTLVDLILKRKFEEAVKLAEEINKFLQEEQEEVED